MYDRPPGFRLPSPCRSHDVFDPSFLTSDRNRKGIEAANTSRTHTRCISVGIEPAMTVIAIVSDTTRQEAVLFEAADHAAELDTDIHVVYLIGMGWTARIEWAIADLLRLGGGVAEVSELSKRQAETVADPVLDEYTPVGLVGKPVQEIVAYAERVDADRIVLDGESKMAVGIASVFRDPVATLRDHGFQVVTVY